MNIIVFYGYQGSLFPRDQPPGFEKLPAEFLQAKALWDKSQHGARGEIIKLIGKFLRARYTAWRVGGFTEIFHPAMDGPAVEPIKITIRTLDFSEFPLPEISAGAEFELLLAPGIDKELIDRFEMSDGLEFYWDFPRDEEMEDLDFSCEGSGWSEFVLIDKPPSGITWPAGIPPYDPETYRHPQYPQAARLVVENQKASISFLARRLRVSFGEACRIMGQMEREGIVSPMQFNGNRVVLVSEYPARKSAAQATLSKVRAFWNKLRVLL